MGTLIAWLRNVSFVVVLPTLIFASRWSYKAEASMPKPTNGNCTLMVGPTKKPVRLLASNTLLFSDISVTFTPPLRPNLICADALLAAVMVTIMAKSIKIFFILLPINFNCSIIYTFYLSFLLLLLRAVEGPV